MQPSPQSTVETFAAAAATKSLQSCPTLLDPIDGSPPGSPVPGILQARTLEWVAISFSNACKWKVKVKLLSRVRLLATPWTAAYQAPPSMGFSRQEYWSGVPLPIIPKRNPISISNHSLFPPIYPSADNHRSTFCLHACIRAKLLQSCPTNFATLWTVHGVARVRHSN